MPTQTPAPPTAAPTARRANRARRSLNAQSIVDLLRASGPQSQAAIARRTELSPAAVNKIVQALKDEGTVQIQWINGREALVELVPKHGTIVSVNVGPQAINGAIFAFGANRRIDLEITDPARIGGPDPVVTLVRELAAQAGVAVGDLAGVSVAIQAPIDRASGGIIAPWAAMRLPRWKDVPIATMLGEALGVPVAVDNDANLGALAEWTWGAGRRSDCFLYVACSVGIGGGLVVDGKLHRGGNGMAFEIGHVVLDANGPVCFCGSRGCLSTVASERSILLALQGSESPKNSLAEVIAAAQAGDPICARVLYEAGRQLGRALANMTKILAPSVIAVGGTLALAGDLVFGGIQTAIEENNVPAFSSSVQLRPAQLGRDATLLGGLASVMGDLGQGLSDLPPWMLDAHRLDLPSVAAAL
ncbi:ROK family transcriptional regulator [Paraburkholderia bannensis]|uniref:ROK family transcriptional regulator n=1 Tax=Paraburkholderia bannensis TaxID=765414 RepID=UPI002AC366A9|nr:ROK family transcriptional regulator [Paraburkholderia bannensis]